jgi:hypothetical protein
MTDSEAAHSENLDRLLEAMPKIAEAVNAFSSEDVQKSAFNALVATFGGTRPASISVKGDQEELAAASGSDVDEEVVGDGDTVEPGSSKPKKARKSSPKRSYPIPKDLNLRPDGKESLKDFSVAKKPRTFPEKNLVIVYYFEEYIEEKEISLGHILAGYDECDWKAPSDPANSLSVTSSKNRWLDTSDMKSITTTHAGRNALKYDMPSSEESKSK